MGWDGMGLCKRGKGKVKEGGGLAIWQGGWVEGFHGKAISGSDS